jgi:hypothetical protein
MGLCHSRGMNLRRVISVAAIRAVIWVDSVVASLVTLDIEWVAGEMQQASNHDTEQRADEQTEKEHRH